MSRRRSIVVGVLALVTLATQLVLVRLMAHGHVADVLLGSGNAAPPIGAAVLAVSLVLVRFAAVVVAPGALLAALASLVAHALVGPPRRGGGHLDGDGVADGDGAADGEADSGPGSGTRSGTGMSSDDEGSGAASGGTGLSIEGRAT